MLEPTTIEQTALNYLLSNLDVLPEHYHLFEVVGTTCFGNNEWMINISMVGLVGKYWNVSTCAIKWEVNKDLDFGQNEKVFANATREPTLKLNKINLAQCCRGLGKSPPVQ